MAINPVFHRLQLLVGASALRNLNRSRVILFGVGGVGSWCAEALVRNGIGYITLVDGERISIPQINRQLQATLVSNGKSKVEELRDRLEIIHGNVQIDVCTEMFSAKNADSFQLGSFDYVLDAMDDPDCKADLIRLATASGCTVFTSLDPCGKLDPTRIRVADLSATECPSGNALWAALQEQSFAGKCLAVYSAEDRVVSPDTGDNLSRDGKAFKSNAPGAEKRAVTGSAVHVTATFGMTLAGLVVDDVLDKAENAERQKRVLSSNHDDEVDA